MLTLTPEMIAGTYELLRLTPPFRSWKLPHADEIEFKVTRQIQPQAFYEKYVRLNEHLIAVSDARIGTLANLVDVTAHEMIHLYEEIAGTTTPGTEHNAQFDKWARLVCRHHGFDYKQFYR